MTGFLQNKIIIALLSAILLVLVIGVGTLLRQQATEDAEAAARRAATEAFMRRDNPVIVGDGKRY